MATKYEKTNALLVARTKPKSIAAGVTVIVLATLTACGAPTKSAGDVAHLFSGSGRSLGDKMSEICGTLRERSASPSLQGITLTDDDCQAAGRAAQNYKQLTSFKFANVNTESINGTAGDKTVKITTRGQVWLNRSLIGLAGALGKSLENKAGTAGGAVTVADSPFGGELVKPKIEVTDKIAFDKEAKEFSGGIKFRLEGAITVDNEIAVAGKIFEDAIAARIDTKEDRDYKDSLLKNMQAVVMIVPHAGDVYVDFSLQLEVHSIGTDAMIAGALQEALSGGMKTMLDGLMAL